MYYIADKLYQWRIEGTLPVATVVGKSMQYSGVTVHTLAILGVDLHREFVYCADHSVYLLCNNGRDDCESWARLIRESPHMPIPTITHPWIHNLDTAYPYISSHLSGVLFESIAEETMCSLVSMLSPRDAASLSATCRRMYGCVMSVYMRPRDAEAALLRAMVKYAKQPYIPLLCRRSPFGANRAVETLAKYPLLADNIDLVVSTGTLTAINLKRVIRSTSIDLSGDMLTRAITCLLSFKKIPGVYEDVCVWLAERRVLDRELHVIQQHSYWNIVKTYSRVQRAALLYGQLETATAMNIVVDDRLVDYLVRFRGFDGLSILASSYILPVSRVHELALWACRFPHNGGKFIAELLDNYRASMGIIKHKLLQIVRDVSVKHITNPKASERNVVTCVALTEKISML